MDKEIVISIKTVLVAFVLALVVYILYRIAPVIGLFLVALMIVFAIEPLVKKIMQGTFLNKKVPRSMAVIISYIVFIAVLVLVVTLWLPPFIDEVQKLIRNIPKIVESIQLGEKIDLNFSDLVPQASQLSGSFLTAVLSLFNNITAVFSVLIMALYMSLDWPNIKNRFSSLFPSKSADVVYDTIEDIEVSIGHWLKGQAFLMVVVGVMSFIGLLVLDIEYPLALGLISGLLEIVPMLGPIIAAVIAAIIALSDSPIKAVGVVALFIIIQQLENNVLVPKVMQKVSGYSPLIILFALLVGSEFFGIIGAVTAVPAAMTLGIIIRRVFRYMK